MSAVDIARLTLADNIAPTARPRPSARRPYPRKGEKFLAGPIPLGWLEQAGRLPGRALHIGIALWFQAGLRRNATVTMPTEFLRQMGVDRFAGARALRGLESAGLVSVERAPGRKPVVTISETRLSTEEVEVRTLRRSLAGEAGSSSAPGPPCDPARSGGTADNHSPDDGSR